ncbi:MAG: hypothetical protein QG670_2536 [Thermoproteota archaeon]|nr:hypothetical protein [Thermoproteota archaeon]
MSGLINANLQFFLAYDNSIEFDCRWRLIPSLAVGFGLSYIEAALDSNPKHLLARCVLFSSRLVC